MQYIMQRVLPAFLFAFFISTSYATLLTQTDSAAFLAALPGPSSVLDFDGLTASTVIADGDTVDGITFNYNFGGVQMLVTNVFDTTSSPNFLGTDDADLFLDGDDFSISFSAANAVGMSFITADPLFDGDIVLSAGGTSVSLSAADVQQTLPDGSNVYFLGIIDDMNTFTTASITTIGGGFFFYNVDDITIAQQTQQTQQVPEPGILLLFAIGMMGLKLRRRS